MQKKFILSLASMSFAFAGAYLSVRLLGALENSGADFAPSSLGTSILVYAAIIATFGVLGILANVLILRSSKSNHRKPYAKAANISSKVNIAIGLVMFLYGIMNIR